MLSDAAATAGFIANYNDGTYYDANYEDHSN